MKNNPTNHLFLFLLVLMLLIAFSLGSIGIESQFGSKESNLVHLIICKFVWVCLLVQLIEIKKKRQEEEKYLFKT